ncbi:MAG: L,D-transpeptidase family protein [Azospirillaceae bacterium]
MLLIAVVLSACVPAGPPGDLTHGAPPQLAEAPPEITSFQGWLDEHGVAYRVPQTGKAIMVNIPAFEVIAFEDGEPVMRSPVIVGTPWDQTPVMETYTSVVRFRPTWRPTPDMVASGEYEDRLWPPGPENPLGLLAIRLEPGLLIYLHGTNRPALFEREDRALSHGCVRVERWDELAAWALDEDLDYIYRMANGNGTVDVPPVPSIPVTLGYFTSFPADDGTLRHFPDIYYREAQALHASNGAFPIQVPE